MEFLRFGSSIPGEYWGCCAVDIIQNFKQDPDTPASIQIVNGDAGTPQTSGRGFVFAGPTLRDIFWQRLRIGTFSTEAMPNHTFIAVLEESQVTGEYGKKWLALLKEAGFEFVRKVDNSVYTGPNLDPSLLTGEVKEEEIKLCPCGCGEPLHDDDGDGESHPNYIFALFRNIGNGRVEDPHEPPPGWNDLPEPKTDVEIWNSLPTKLLSEEEVVAAGAPVIYAGRRSMFPPQLKEKREATEKEMKDKGVVFKPSGGTQQLYKGKHGYMI